MVVHFGDCDGWDLLSRMNRFQLPSSLKSKYVNQMPMHWCICGPVSKGCAPTQIPQQTAQVAQKDRERKAIETAWEARSVQGSKVARSRNQAARLV